jgi:NADPH:quinone reductase-like Zn-dependent oxidoreductase
MLPTSMRALVVQSHVGGADAVALADVPVATPGPGRVLIRVARAPLNPNDLLALRAAYTVPKPVGEVAGFEGSGVVVAGNGLMARLMVGRRVAFQAAAGSGAWAEYAVADAMACVPLRPDATDDEGAVLLTNPLTASVLVGKAKAEGHRAVVQAAAAGALGKMVARLALHRGLPMIHVVRSQAQQDALRALGATEVLDSTAPGFEAELASRCAALGATLALDPVAGPTTGTLLHALPDGGVVRVYGALSGAPSTFDPDDVVFHGKRIEGFTMYAWVRDTPLPLQVLTVMRAQAMLRGPLATEIRARVPLSDWRDAIAGYERAMSGGKVLFVPA